MPVMGLQALTSPVCAFWGLYDATASPGAAPTGFTPSRTSRWTDTTEVAVRLITPQMLTPQYTWARHGACGRPRPRRELQAGPEHRASCHYPQALCKGILGKHNYSSRVLRTPEERLPSGAPKEEFGQMIFEKKSFLGECTKVQSTPSAGFCGGETGAGTCDDPCILDYYCSSASL